MTNIPAAALPLSTSPFAPARFGATRAFVATAIAIIRFAVLPYLVYGAVAPRFPDGSVIPLLASTVPSLFGLTVSLLRRRTLDVLPVILLCEILVSIAVALAVEDVRLAIIARALQVTLTGFLILLSVRFRRPFFHYVAKQFVVFDSPEGAKEFEAANLRDRGGRTFRILTTVWGVAVVLMSFVHLGLSVTIPPSDYVLFSPLISIGTNVAMAIGTVRFSTKRLTPRQQ